MRTICRTPEQMEEAVQWLTSAPLISPDVETIPFKKKMKHKQPFVMTVVSYSAIHNGELRSYAFQLTRQKSSLDGEAPFAAEALDAIRRINASPVPKTLHNGVYDCAWFIRYGVPLNNYAYDSMTLFWSRYPDLPKTLDFVASILLDSYSYWKMGRKSEDFIGHTIYAMADTETTLLCTIRLLQWAAQDHRMIHNFHLAHLRCLTGLSMSLKGMEVDFTVFEAMRIELEKEAEKALTHLRWLVADEEFNPNSPKQKLTLFYEMLGAKPRNAKGRILKRLGGKAKPSVGDIVLRALKSEHPFIRVIVEALQKAQAPAKQISNVIGLAFMDWRFRTGYDGVGTTTSRLSSRQDAFGFGGNAQNIRKKYRRFLKAEDRKFIFELDFSAADDVYVSYESEEQKKIRIIEEGYDTHSYNASQVYFPNWKYEDVVKGKKEWLDAEKTQPNPLYLPVSHPITGIRQITKKLTHGGNYLMAGHTLLNSAGREAIVGAAIELGHADAGRWSIATLVDFCEWMDARYRQYYPRFARAGAGSFYADLSLGLRERRYFETIFGYCQYFLADPMADSTLRALAATVGQANTAGRVNMAMLELDQGIRIKRFRDGDAPDFDEPALPVNEFEHGISMRLQTHDSLTFVCDADHSNLKEGIDRVFRVMRRPAVCKGRIIRIGVEADVAINWAHKVTEVAGNDDVESWVKKNFVDMAA